MDSDTALIHAQLRKLACECGVLLEACKRNKQLSAGARVHSAREDLLAALHSYNPKNDESQLNLGGESAFV